MINTRITSRPAFSAADKFFHWITVLLLVVQYAIGWLMPDVHRDTKPVGLVGLHLSVGALIVIVMLGRFVWRLMHPLLPEPEMVPRVFRTAARVTHWLLYALLIAFPLMGWANASSRGWAVSLFHIVPLPPLAATGSSTGHALGDVHKFTAWVLIALVGFHVLGALFHHLILRDDTLRRMLPGRRNHRPNR
ncbi:cytochrome B561 [Caballeronia terrestris]|uniref:Cytochrome B561 n=1 Tax=Caballeronia terrestris TaxID=1226301 RepID=A0A158IK71_9BURK|nr:cytochrome b [Caballeronia terrestris]SAL56958.1 cytochrome B561 [Caballeronia terrestris]